MKKTLIILFLAFATVSSAQYVNLNTGELYQNIPSTWTSRGTRWNNYQNATALHHGDGWRPASEMPWCDEGFTIENTSWELVDGTAIVTWDCVEIPVEIPEEVTRRQFRIALVLAGIELSDVENALNSIEDPTERAIALIEWQDALTFKRSHTLINSFAPMFNLSEEDLDQLFLTAASFE